jgi:hypothetical protein
MNDGRETRQDEAGREREGWSKAEKSRKREREIRGERVDVDGRWRKALIWIFFWN